MSRSTVTALLSVVTLTACDPAVTKPTTPPDPMPSRQQTWLCGREYTNNAWGYQHQGLVVDMAGNIWRYDHKDIPNQRKDHWQVKDLNSITEDEVKLRYDGAKATAQKISAAEIAQYFPLIAEAAKTKSSEPQGRGADMGQHVVYCYTYDPTKRAYAQVTLDDKGDWESTNPSPAARKLAAWLDKAFADVK